MENLKKIRERAEKIGKLSLSIINKCQNSCGKNDVWESAVNINAEAKKIYENSVDEQDWEGYLAWCKNQENFPHE